MNLKHACILVTPLFVAGLTLAADEPAGREPNVRIDASAALINALVQRSIDETEPVNEIIQDTPVCGIGRTLGNVYAELIPDTRHATIDIAMQGVNYSETVGARHTIRIHTFTTTPLQVRRRIVIGETGINLLAGPSSAVACTQLIDVTSTMDMDYLAKCMVRRGFENTRPAAEAESACKTVGHVIRRIDDEINPALATASSTLGRELRAFRQTGLLLEAMRFSTSTSHVHGAFRFATPGRTSPVPMMLSSDFDLAARIHESVATEAAQTEFGGRTFSLTEVSKIYNELTRGLILDARSDADIKLDLEKLAKLAAQLAGKPVIVTLPKRDPLIVTFADQGFTLEGRVESVQQDKTTYAGLRVKVAYRLENRADGVYALRKGPVRVALDKGNPEKKVDAMPAATGVIMETMLTEFMKERIKLAALPMLDPIASRLLAPRAAAANGWFALVWKLRKR
ncbi:MAG TPA: hypothetical protein VFE62_18425 [Gemmataceae bacterium]|nr:hypothetical protein [Gemmataceae bacterium]